MGEIAVLNQKGDEKIEWDPADEESTKTAKKKFKELKDKGYEFFEVADAKGKKIKRFSKGLGKLIAAPAAQTSTRTGRAAMGGGPNHARPVL